MFDPFKSMQGLTGQLQQFMSNPLGALVSKNMGIPQQYMNNADEVIQYLMNTGKISQAQYNELNQKAKQIQKSPDFKKFMGIQ